MHAPDAAKHDPRPEYLRALLAAAGLTQAQAAQALGIGPRMMKYYLEVGGQHRAPYVVQYALEALAEAAR